MENEVNFIIKVEMTVEVYITRRLEVIKGIKNILFFKNMIKTSDWSPFSITNDIPWISIFNLTSAFILSLIDHFTTTSRILLPVLCGISFILHTLYYCYVVVAHWIRLYPLVRRKKRDSHVIGHHSLVITYSDIFDFIVSLPMALYNPPTD